MERNSYTDPPFLQKDTPLLIDIQYPLYRRERRSFWVGVFPLYYITDKVIRQGYFKSHVAERVLQRVALQNTLSNMTLK